MIDVVDSKILKRHSVVIQNGKVKEIGKTVTINDSINSRIYDLEGKYLLPGFIDMHAHVTILDFKITKSKSNKMIASYKGYNFRDSKIILKRLLSYGITTVRNPAGPTKEAIQLRKKVKEGKVVGPDIFTAGHAINFKRSTKYKKPKYYGAGVVLSRFDDIRKEIQRQYKLGVNFIKIYASLDKAQSHEAIKVAHELNLPVIGHLTKTKWIDAALMNIDYLTHGVSWSPQILTKSNQAHLKQLKKSGRSFMRRRIDWLEMLKINSPQVRQVIDKLAINNIVVDPTLVAYETKFKGNWDYYTENPRLSELPDSIVSMWRQGTYTSDWIQKDYQRAHLAWPKLLKLIKMYHKRGVKLTVGSDMPNPWVIPGFGFHREMELLREAGIPPFEILKMATINGADALGKSEEIGSVEIGKKANLLVLDADPTKNISNTLKINMVIKEGMLYRDEGMDKD